MKSKEIEGIEKEFNHEKYDPPEINFLRKERQVNIMKKEIKEKINLNKKVVLNKVQNDIPHNFIDTQTKIKIFDSNKYSFDSNGKIISFKPIQIDSLSMDFTSIKDSIKSLDNNRLRKFKFTKKSKNEGNNGNSTKRNNKSNNSRILTIIKNPEDDPNGINKKNYAKVNLDKNFEITPSGSNFSILLPNVGVILKEDEQIKEGDRDFGNYFKKYSLNDYNKILRDYLPLQNKTMLKTKMSQSMINTTTKKIPKNNSFITNTNNVSNTAMGNNALLSTLTPNYSQINNIFNNADISNPLINSGDTIQENEYNNSYNDDLNINNLNSINNISLIKSIRSNKNLSYNNSLLNTTPISLIRNGSYDSLSGFIKLNKNGTSLKNELDSLKDLDEDSNIKFYLPLGKRELNTNNIFASIFKDSNKNKRKQILYKNNLNEFNKKIILSKGWGTKTLSKNMSTGNLLFSKHQTKYQILRELGSTLLNRIKTKLPRERKVDIKI